MVFRILDISLTILFGHFHSPMIYCGIMLFLNFELCVSFYSMYVHCFIGGNIFYDRIVYYF